MRNVEGTTNAVRPMPRALRRLLALSRGDGGMSTAEYARVRV